MKLPENKWKPIHGPQWDIKLNLCACVIDCVVVCLQFSAFGLGQSLEFEPYHCHHMYELFFECCFAHICVCICVSSVCVW